MNNTGDDKKLDWMYKGATNLVDREEYLLGRSVDKTLEQLNAEEKEKKLGLVPPKNHVEHECIPPSIRDFNKIAQADQVDISAKLQEDPLVAIKKREEEARRQFLQNPVQLKKLQEALKAQQMKKKKKTHKKSKTDSDSDLDNKIAKKLKYLKGDPSALCTKKLKKKSKSSALDTILMHKFNQLKDRLSQDDLNDILAGNTSDSDKETKERKEKRKKNSSSDESESDSKEARRSEQSRSSGRDKSQKVRRRNSDDSSEEGTSGNKYRNKKEVERRQREVSNQNRKNLKYHMEEDRGNRSRSVDRDSYKYNPTAGKAREKNRNRLENESSKAREKNTSDNGKKEAVREGQENKYSNDSTSDLESRILQKLRMLRDSVKSKGSENSDNEDNSKKHTRKANDQKNNISTDESSSDSSESSVSQKPSRYYDSDSDEALRKPKAFGLVKSDGTKLALNKTSYETKKSDKSVTKDDSASKLDRKNVKKLSEEEKEKLRREMMKNAEKRDKERSDNLRRYREEDKKESLASANYDKDFLRKELLKTTKDATVETRIKSNLNNIQRSSKHMDSHFSRRK